MNGKQKKKHDFSNFPFSHWVFGVHETSTENRATDQLGILRRVDRLLEQSAASPVLKYHRPSDGVYVVAERVV